VVVLSVVAACEGESDATGPGGGTPEPAINEVVSYGPLNASSSDTLVYFAFATGGTVRASDAWDIAFRRYEIRLNSPATAGGASRGVTGVSLDNSRSATNADVLGFTPAGTLAAFDAVRAAAIPADSLFQTDRLTANPQAYLNLGGVPSANAAAYWKVRLANGTFALVRATAIAFTPQFQVQSLTLESRLQSGTTLGPTQTLSVTPAGQVTAISFVSNSVVTAPSGCNWDFSFNPASNQLALTVNTACNVGTYPGPASPTFAAATAASDAPQYAAYLSALVGPIPNSVTDLSAPFRYNLAGTMRLHPSFNTYLVRTGTRIYKLQVIDYYSNTGASAYPTIRYARIR
jgi:hypothetical protein